MQVRTLLLFCLGLFALFGSRANCQTAPAAVAQEFCNLELQGTGLDGRYSRQLWDLTVGEEEPFMGGSRIASECKVLKTTVASPSQAVVIIQYHVIGRIVEDAEGSKSIVKLNKYEEIPLRLKLTNGKWKISRTSLMNVPEHSTAKVWADHFQKLIEPDEKRKTGADRNLEKVVAQLRRM